MTIYLATDHAGFELKEFIKEELSDRGMTVVDLGAHTYDEYDDYPDFISKLKGKLLQDGEDKAIIFGGSGQGEAIVANKYTNIRAVVYYSHNEEIITLSRKHNNANVLSIGARFISKEEALKSVLLWLETSFDNEDRHKRRIEKIQTLEQ